MLIRFLESNIDMFAWSTYDAPRIDPEFICHQLNVNYDAVPRRQPPKRSSKERAKVVKDKVNKLKKANVTKEIFYPKCGQYSGGEEEEREVACKCRFHGFE